MSSGLPLFPAQASTFAPQVDNLYFFLVALTAFFAILIAGLVVFFAIKYRSVDGSGVGAPITGSIPLELMWTILPFGISMIIFVWATSVFFDYTRVPDQPLEIYSVGKRWMWKFQHLDGKAEINQLHVPLGRPVKVTFTSEDVLHDLFIPSFRVKADAIPGRYSTIWFTATKLGEFHLFCAEYCGTRHSGMIGSVVVMEPAAYQDWLSSGGSTATLAARGEQLFSDLACTTCHRNDGTGRGPSLEHKFGSEEQLATGRAVRIDESYVRESILNPQAKLVAGYQPLMPTFQGLVDEESVMALIEYVKSLSAAEGPSTGSNDVSAAEPGTAAPQPAATQENR